MGQISAEETEHAEHDELGAEPALLKVERIFNHSRFIFILEHCEQ